MIPFLLAVCSLFLAPQTRGQASSPSAGLADPAYAKDGRLALTLNGNIWVVQLKEDHSSGNTTTEAAASWLQITNSPADDRDPAWTPDGHALVFTSDRSGTYDLWHVEARTGATRPDPVRLTHSQKADTEPHLAADGAMVWVRGFGPDADLWLKKAGGKEEQLTKTLGAEHSPAFSPDGSTIAYIAKRKGRKRLRLFFLSDQTDTLVVGDMSPEYPTWSPAGDRIAFSTRGRQPGVWLTPLDGRYKNLVSSVRAVSAWSPDGARLALVSLPRTPPAYNGDPAGPGPRRYDMPPSADRALTFVNVPPAPDAERTTLLLEAPASATAHFVERFDRVAAYLTQRYRLDKKPTKAAWKAVKNKYRAAAQAATDEAALEQAIYALLRERPLLRPEASGRAVVSSAHPSATAAGLEVLAQGGNVVDAAVAVSFALGVVEPDASGVGGYGEMLIFLNGMAAPTCIEFLTRVPEAASLSNGGLRPLPQDGPVLTNVPGTVAGMELAWTRYGSDKLKWAQLIEPALKLARDGFILDHAFATTLSKEKERYLQYESSRSLFYPDSAALQPGDTLRNRDLAWTLGRIAQQGGKVFYRGEIAKRMVEDLRGKGNVLTLTDLARYYAVEREPVMITYRGHTVYSGPPPVSGGAALAGKLNLLEQVRHPKAYRDDAATLHAMIEAWKLAPSTRDRIADPGLWPVDLKPFTDKQLAKQRWRSCFDPQQSTSPDKSACLNESRVAAAWGADGVLDANSSTGTTSFVVADARGNLVVVTQTLGTWGGNFYVTPGLGFLYNDKLRSYRSDPKRYNARIPFARNVTSIAPTLVFKGTGKERRPYLAVGAAGNAWITSAVYQIVVGVVDHGLGPQQAIEQPRFLVSVRRDPKKRQQVREIVVQVEDGFAPGVLRQLRTLGHDLQRISLRGELRMGYASAAVIEDGRVRAGADPRRSGQAGAIQ